MGWQTEVVQFVIISSGGPASGLFVYNGSPGPGNPPVFAVVAPGTTTDPYGNAVQAVMNAGDLAGAHFGLDDDGNAYLADSTGATRIYLSPSAQILNFYTAATASLLLSLAGTAGTDPFTGQAYDEGLELWGSSGQKIIMGLAAGNPIIYYVTGRAEENLAAFTQAEVNNIGLATEYLYFIVKGPSVTTYADYAYVNFLSSTKDGSGDAGGNLVYSDRSGLAHTLLEWGSGGLLSPGLNDQNPMTVGELVLTVTADQTINTFGYQLIGGLDCNMAANSVYLVEGSMLAENITAAVNDLWACVFPSGSTVNMWGSFLQNSASGPVVGASNTNGLFSSPPYGTGVVYQFQFGGIVKTGSSSGSFQVQGSESATGDTWKVFANWYVKVRRVSGG